ncbi:hypothetical protein ACJX0J_032818 [Zea mays]
MALYILDLADNMLLPILTGQFFADLFGNKNTTNTTFSKLVFEDHAHVGLLCGARKMSKFFFSLSPLIIYRLVLDIFFLTTEVHVIHTDRPWRAFFCHIRNPDYKKLKHI